MAEQVKDTEFVEFVVRAMVDKPEDVSVERTVDERGVLLTLKVNPSDMGYIIGKQGANARALRTLLRVVGARQDERVNLKIYEPEGSRRPERRSDRGETASADKEGDTSIVDELTI